MIMRFRHWLQHLIDEPLDISLEAMMSLPRETASESRLGVEPMGQVASGSRYIGLTAKP